MLVAILAFAGACLIFLFLAFGDLANAAKWSYIGLALIALGLLVSHVGPVVGPYIRRGE